MTQRDDPRAGRRRRAGGAEPLSRGEPRGERLSRERILEAAIGVVERDGVEGLSMRRLAQELDVWPMSVYRYFQDKDALLDAMAAHSAAPATGKPAGGTWQEQLKTLLDDARRQIAASAEIGARIPRAFLEPEPLKLTETAMQILKNAGFDAGEAARAWRALYSYTFGFA
ncbi:MAG TPA: TetR family transcriptional regulator, partial [Thermoleophilaceae bacterium]